MGDTGNALLAAIAVTAALYHRDRTGEGQAVATSIVNAGLLHTSYVWIHADGTPGDWRHVDGDQYGLSAFYRMYRCADEGWLFLPPVTAAGAGPAGHDAAAESEDVTLEADRAEEALVVVFSARRTAAEWVERPRRVRRAGGVRRRAASAAPSLTTLRRSSLQLVAETWSGSVGRFEDSGFLVNLAPASCVIQRGPVHVR